MKKADIYIGQTFVATNPDYYVLDETWKVTAIDDSTITFDVMKYWLRDAAYVEISSTDIMKGEFFMESPQGLVCTFPSDPGWGILLSTKGAYYLLPKEFDDFYRHHRDSSDPAPPTLQE